MVRSKKRKKKARAGCKDRRQYTLQAEKHSRTNGDDITLGVQAGQDNGSLIGEVTRYNASVDLCFWRFGFCLFLG